MRCLTFVAVIAYWGSQDTCAEVATTPCVTDVCVSNPVTEHRKMELLQDVKAKVRGIALPLLTFYQDNGEVDHEAMTKYVQQMISDGLVEGKGVILAVASGGDFPSLSVAERKATAKTVIEAADGKVPCFLSVQESHLADVIELAKYAEEIGYYGIQLSVPYYWTTSPGDAIAWFQKVHDATNRVIISFYDTPWENFDASLTVLKEASKLERVRVLKLFTDQAPMTFRWTEMMIALRDEYAIIDNTLQPVLNHMLGGTSFITHLASVWPKQQLEMFDKLQRGDFVGALAMQQNATVPWYDFRIKAGDYTSGEAPPVKAALVMAGRIKTPGPQRLPSRDLSPALMKELRAMLVKIGVPGVQPETNVATAVTTKACVTDVCVQNPVSEQRKMDLLKDVKAKVRGIALPLLTFYQDNGEVDHEAMTKYVQQMISDGLVEGKGVILAVASGGDFPSLSVAERKATAKTVIEAAAGKVPCFLSVQESHLADVIELAKYAEEIGYYGIQLSVPYYWTTSPGDAIAWFQKVHDATNRVIISFYDTPWENFDAPLSVLKEASKLERVRVLKLFTDQAPMTFRWTEMMMALRDEYAIIDNTLQPVANHMLGGTSFITHLASVWPEQQLEMYGKLERGDFVGALAMQQNATVPWYDFRIKAGDYTSGEAPPVKAALVMAGRIKTTGPQRLPSRDLSPALMKDLRAMLVKIGVPGVQPETREVVV